MRPAVLSPGSVNTEAGHLEGQGLVLRGAVVDHRLGHGELDIPRHIPDGYDGTATTIGILRLLGVLVTGPAPALAHQGWSGYDSAREMTLTGTSAAAGYEHRGGHEWGWGDVSAS